jgi:hypothetical protein
MRWGGLLLAGCATGFCAAGSCAGPGVEPAAAEAPETPCGWEFALTPDEAPGDAVPTFFADAGSAIPYVEVPLTLWSPTEEVALRLALRGRDGEAVITGDTLFVALSGWTPQSCVGGFTSRLPATEEACRRMCAEDGAELERVVQVSAVVRDGLGVPQELRDLGELRLTDEFRARYCDP